MPANVGGTWKLPTGELTLKQEFQMVSGTLVQGGTSTPVTGKLRGDLITLTAGNIEFAGRITGDTMEGSAKHDGTTSNVVASRVK